MQRCVEILNSLPELSHKAQMISSKATLVLADTTCIRGIDHTPSNDDMDMGEQIAEVFAGLIKTMKKQVRSLLGPIIYINLVVIFEVWCMWTYCSYVN